MSMLRNASLFALLTLILGVVPLVMAAVYAIRPTERNLALMRPLSLAGLFAAIAGTLSGFINVLRLFWSREPTPCRLRMSHGGLARRRHRHGTTQWKSLAARDTSRGFHATD